MGAGSSVRRLVVAYSALWALIDLVAVLPGSNLGFSSVWGFVGSLLVQGLLVWRLSLGSSLAWGSGLFTALGSVVFLGLTGPTIGVAEILFVILCLAQAVVLLFPQPGRGWGIRGCAA